MGALDAAELAQMVEGRYVSVKGHPEADLWIHNYTPRAQYQRMWNETTMQCRGLILDGNGDVVARPFRKFFNLGERPDEQYPAEPFEVYDKLDGSLGISYWHAGKPHIATRGSFTSPQAAVAEKMLCRYPAPDPALTYLWEIIHPMTRIVVDYGQREALVLLAVIDPRTGAELPHAEMMRLWPEVVDAYGMHDDPEGLPHRDGAEGFVLRWPSTGQRAKVKYADYQRLHRLLTGTTPHRIWEVLRAGDEADWDRLTAASDDYKQWVGGIRGSLERRYQAIEQEARSAFVDLGDRKTNALHYQQYPWPQLLFAMLDDKPYADMVWKLLEPKGGNETFRRDEP